MGLKYYFICYEWTRQGMTGWDKNNAVIKVHPVEWLKDMIDNYDERFRITFFSEIEEKQYDLIHGWID